MGNARDGVYALPPVAAEYLDERSPISLGGYLDFGVANYKLWSMESMKAAVLTNSPQVGGGDLFSTPEAQRAFAKAFTKAMHAHSIGSALEWPDKVDLSKHRVLLDIGGGSGAQTVGVLLRWPNLRGIVLDTPPVTAEAEHYVERYHLGDRIELRAADMWTDPFPRADVHLYGDIFHDWPKDRGAFLARKSFETLPTGGKIILREVLFDDDKRGPVALAAYSVNMLLVTLGGQYSKSEIDSLLFQTGFRDVKIGPPAAGYRSLIVAQKRVINWGVGALYCCSHGGDRFQLSWFFENVQQFLRTVRTVAASVGCPTYYALLFKPLDRPLRRRKRDAQSASSASSSDKRVGR